MTSGCEVSLSIQKLQRLEIQLGPEAVDVTCKQVTDPHTSRILKRF